MTFGAEEVTNAALQALAMAKKNRDKSYEESNMIYMLNKSLDECEDHATREKLFQLKNDYSDEKINNAFAMDSLKLLLSNRPTSASQQNETYNVNYNVNNSQYFFKNFAENETKDFLSNKEASYMFDDDKAKVDKFIDSCLTREIDPVVHATKHLDRSEVVQYSDFQIWSTFQKMHTRISATDFEKKEVFKEIPNYINQLRTNVYTISLFGEVNSGKSTVVNCIIGLEVAYTFLETCTALPVIYENDQHQEIPILTLSNYFLQHGFNRTYEGPEILPILTSINEVSRKRQDNLNYDDWPLIKVRFRNAIRPIRIIDTPGISEQSEVLTNYSKLALEHSVSTMVIFRCDRINTDIEQSLKENLSDEKHLCLVANRWDEYQHNVDGDKTASKEALRSRLEQTYQKVFVTIADIGFLSAKMAKITSTSKSTWEAAKPWAQKCMSTTLTNLKDLESDYEEMTLCTLKRRVAVGLHNSGIDELVNYINGDMLNDMKYKAISYICTAFITHLQQFENKDEKERQNDMTSIFKVNEELKKISHKRDKITELIQVSRDFVYASTSDIFLKGESFRNIHNYLENKFDEIKQEARNISYTDTTNIARSSMDDIIFYVEDSYKITNFIRNEISKVFYECITNEVDEINGKLNEVLSDAGSGLLGSDLYMYANTCIDVLDIDDFSYTGDISFHTSSVRIEGSNAVGGFKINERISDHLISISQASYMEEVYRIAQEVLATYKSRINLHIDNAIYWYLESINEGGTKIFKDLDAISKNLTEGKIHEMKSLRKRIRHDLMIKSCILISKSIKEKYSPS